jgi:AraC-like DNA-binding protein
MKPPENVADAGNPRMTLRAKLQEVEAYLGSGAESRRVGCYMRDLGSDEHFWSPEVFELAGISIAARAPGMDDFWLAAVGRKQTDYILSAVQRCVEERSPLELTYTLRQPGGTVKQVRSVGAQIPSRAGHGIAIMGTVFDVTDHQRACTALHEAFELLRGIDVGEGPTTGARVPADVVATPGGHGEANAGGDVIDTVRFVSVPGGLSARQFARVYELIQARQRDPLEVGELAAAAGLSAAHFARAFKRTTGKTPHRFILEHRLEHARAALALGPAEKLAGVALEFGFFDQSHFTRHFRRKFGVTPGDFVRQTLLPPVERLDGSERRHVAAVTLPPTAERSA